MPLFNEGDRFNGKPHGEAVPNPEHAKRLRCPVCGKPAFLRQGEDRCWWCRHLESDIRWNRQQAEIERNEAADNSPARQSPNSL